MSKADEYREIANECIASARMSRSKQQRKQLLELAQTWMTAASLLEQGAKERLGGDYVAKSAPHRSLSRHLPGRKQITSAAGGSLEPGPPLRSARGGRGF